MISKFGVGILLAVATLFFATPTNTFAASSGNSAKIKKYFNQLKKLPNAAAPASQVNSLVTKLAKLDPKKSNKYYKLGLTKLGNPGGTAISNAATIAKRVLAIVKKAGLSTSSTRTLVKQVTNSKVAFVPPPATSASAMLYDGFAATIA